MINLGNLDSIVVCPNKIKMKLLKEAKKLQNMKYMTKEEYRDHYFFSYTKKTLDYLMNKYSYCLEVSKIIINQLYVIDLDKEYKSNKLKELQKIKKDLIENNYLIFDLLFLNYIKDKQIIVYGYYNLEKYEEEMFKNATIIKEEKKDINTLVTSCNTLEEEVIYVAEEILKLLKRGVSLNKIFLFNITTDYLYTIHKIFSYYHIPINLDIKESIYGTNIVDKFVNSNTISDTNNQITIKLIDVVNNLVEIEDSTNYQEFLIDEIKNTYIKPKKYKNAVNILNELEIVDDDSYLFILGLNQDSLPVIHKDEDYINDNIKDEVLLYKTTYKNKQEKEYLKIVISNTSNIYLSYKKRSNFSEYLKSSFITDNNLKEVEYKLTTTNNDFYNKLLLGKGLDNYYKYSEVSKNLKPLYNHYNISYRTYDNSFTNLNLSNYSEYISNKLRLSYTSFNTYSLCKFQYYIKYILKLDPFTDNFNTMLGTCFHYFLSICFNENFNFDKEWDNYKKKLELSKKDDLFLELLKDTLKKDIEILKNQKEYTSYQDTLYEKEVNIKLNDKVNFTGIIDKIMYQEKNNQTLLSVIDYKTGTITTNVNNMKYGLNMQLPIYLYLIHYSNMFKNVKFSGIYLQKILHKMPKYKKDFNIDSIYKDNLKLQGYSTNCKEILSLFDKTYEKSELIKGMRIKKDESFYDSAKVLDDIEFESMIEYTKKLIEEWASNILEGDFSINPKIMDNDNLSCKYCKYQDLCFRTGRDNVTLEKQQDLSFLGGIDYGMDQRTTASN